MSLNHFNGMYAMMMRRNQGYVCTYAFNADASVITGFIGADARLALSNGDQKGSYTTTGVTYVAGMAPSGIDTSTQQTFDVSSGKTAIEFDITLAANAGTGLAYVTSSADSSTRDVFILEVGANPGGAFSVALYYNAPFTILYQALGLVSPPSRIGVLMDATTNQIQLYLDGVAVAMTSDVLRPDTDVSLTMFAGEFVGAQAGLGLAIEAITSASSMTASYPSGTVDICGNPV